MRLNSPENKTKALFVANSFGLYSLKFRWRRWSLLSASLYSSVYFHFFSLFFVSIYWLLMPSEPFVPLFGKANGWTEGEDERALTKIKREINPKKDFGKSETFNQIYTQHRTSCMTTCNMHAAMMSVFYFHLHRCQSDISQKGQGYRFILLHTHLPNSENFLHIRIPSRVK